jgi:VanZ family protein
MRADFVFNIFSPDARLKHFKWWLVIGFALIAGINYWSLTSSVWIPMPGHTDKIYHAGTYAGLMLWWLQLFPSRSARVLLAVIFIAMGIALEVLQSFSPMRYMDYADMAANAAGVAIAFVMGFTALDQLLFRFERRMVK